MTARWGVALVLLVALLSRGTAQEAPIHGCGNVSISCQSLGFSTLGTNPNAVVFGGFRFGPSDLHFSVVTPRSRPNPEQYSTSDVRVFHLRNVSLLPPTPTPTPRPAASSPQATRPGSRP